MKRAVVTPSRCFPPFRPSAIVLAGLGALAGCAPFERTPDFPTSSAKDAQTDSPFILQHTSTPTDEATTGDGDPVLQVPVSLEHARNLARAYFTAIGRQSVGALEGLLSTPDESVAESANLGARLRILNEWQARFAKLDYSAVSAEVLFYEREVELYRASEWLVLGAERSSHLRPSGSQVLVVVPIRFQGKGKVRYFGTRLEMLVAHGREGPAILELHEDFQLP